MSKADSLRNTIKFLQDEIKILEKERYFPMKAFFIKVYKEELEKYSDELKYL